MTIYIQVAKCIQRPIVLQAAKKFFDFIIQNIWPEKVCPPMYPLS